MFFFVEGGKPENPEKKTRRKTTTNNKLKPHMAPGGNRTRAKLVEGKRLLCSPELYRTTEAKKKVTG